MELLTDAQEKLSAPTAINHSLSRKILSVKFHKQKNMPKSVAEQN